MNFTNPRETERFKYFPNGIGNFITLRLVLRDMGYDVTYGQAKKKAEGDPEREGEISMIMAANMQEDQDALEELIL